MSASAPEARAVLVCSPVLLCTRLPARKPSPKMCKCVKGLEGDKVINMKLQMEC